MPALLEVQRAFSLSLLAEDNEQIAGDILPGGFSASERLGIYGNTCRSTLIAALRMAYPAVDRLVGGDFFDAAAGQFVALHPPRSAYLNAYGCELADFLADLDAAKSVPYLADVARFEWALSVAANAEDVEALDAAALISVPPADHADLSFTAHPSLTCLELAYPADRIADAVLGDNETAMAELDLSAGPIHLVVHRGAEGLEAQRLEPHAYEFVSRLFAGERLGAIIEAASDDAPALLAEQLRKGRLATFEVPQL